MTSILTWLMQHLCGCVKRESRKTYYVAFLPIFRIAFREHRKDYLILGIRVFSKKRWRALLQTELQHLYDKKIADTINSTIDTKSNCLRDEIKRTKDEFDRKIAELINSHDKRTSLQATLDIQRSNILYLNWLHKSHNNEDYFLLFDCLYDKYAEAIDARSFYVYLKERGIAAKYVLRSDNPLAPTFSEDENVVLVKDSEDFILHHHDLIAGARYILTSFGFFNEYDQLLKELPFCRYIFIEHGVIYLKGHVTAYYNPRVYNNILVPSTGTLQMYRERKVWQEQDMILAGLPRWDLLSRQPHEGKNIFIFFTWRATFSQRPERAQAYFDQIHSLLTNPAFRRIVSDYGIKVRIAMHHTLVTKHVELPYMGEHVEIVDTSCISRHIGSTDLLITDYSSICFDFMFLNIPVLFYHFDFDSDDLDKVDTDTFAYVRSKNDSLYNCVNQEDEALAIIEQYARNGFVLEEENRQKNERFFWERKDIRQHLLERLEAL